MLHLKKNIPYWIYKRQQKKTSNFDTALKELGFTARVVRTNKDFETIKTDSSKILNSSR